jgi:GT2 family glycosyltransferase
MHTDKISIIMPVLNEAKILGRTLDRLRLSEHEELVVVDGGSSDETIPIAREFTKKVYTCTLPDKGFSIIRDVLSDMSVAAGAFRLRIDHRHFRYRIIEIGTNIRTHVTSLFYGDQGMFLRKEVFHRIGGFADIPLMEDIEISRRLRREGRTVIVKPPIVSSPRRWLDEGVIYTTLRDWTIAFLYTFMNISPSCLIRYYRDVR